MGTPIIAFECPLVGIQVVPRKCLFRPEQLLRAFFDEKEWFKYGKRIAQGV